MSKKHNCGCNSENQSFESHVDSGCSSGCECGSSDIEKKNAEYESKVDKNPNKKTSGNNQW